jgi:uncharacterized GH25 family protein
MFRWSLTLILSVLFTAPVYAHEFWISPVKYEIDINQSIEAHFRVGQRFNGSSNSFLSRYTTRQEVVQMGKIIQVMGRNGDRPAFQMAGLPNGLAVLVHETTDSTLTYRDYEKFVAFVKHKNFEGQPEAHTARGLPKVGFVESYRRFAKSLLAIGDGVGQDMPIGLDIEIVALKNPYTDDLSNGMQVRILMAGLPRAQAQVELFERAFGTTDEAKVSLYQTDAEGIATFPVIAGREYMVDNVALLPLEPEVDGNPVWHSLWANLTFMVPSD